MLPKIKVNANKCCKINPEITFKIIFDDCSKNNPELAGSGYTICEKT